MGLTWPNYPDHIGGDEQTESPTKHQQSLLGGERGTNLARRLETDAARNLYVRIAADDVAPPARVSALASDDVANVPNGSLTTILTFTAAADTRVTRISVSGTDYAKFQVFLNTVLLETKRSGPDRSLDFAFVAPLGMDAGNVLDIKVTHYAPTVLADFESTVYGA